MFVKVELYISDTTFINDFQWLYKEWKSQIRQWIKLKKIGLCTMASAKNRNGKMAITNITSVTSIKWKRRRLPDSWTGQLYNSIMYKTLIYMFIKLAYIWGRINVLRAQKEIIKKIERDQVKQRILRTMDKMMEKDFKRELARIQLAMRIFK